jgi:hypothetical protein
MQTMPTLPELYFEKLCLDAEGLVVRGDWRGAFKVLRLEGKNPYLLFDARSLDSRVFLGSVRALSDVQKQALLRLHMELADWSRDPHSVPALQMTDPLVPLYAGLSPYFCEETSHSVLNPTTQVRYVLSALGVIVGPTL